MFGASIGGNVRINDLSMSMGDIIKVLGGGNPGGITVCMQLLEHGPAIDPDNAFGGLGQLLNLDSDGIYEHRIWMLFKDVCRENLAKMVAVMRAKQLGIINQATLDTAIDNRGQGLNVDEVLAKVKERLPKFNEFGHLPTPKPVFAEAPAE